MSSPANPILAAAKTIQAELPTLFADTDPVAANTIAADLDRLIAAVETGEADSLDLEEFLSDYPETQKRLSKLFPLDMHERSYQSLAGSRQIAVFQIYCCPEPDCTHRWPRRDGGQEIPHCPTHHQLLILQPHPSTTP